jgi:hypothetical protein
MDRSRVEQLLASSVRPHVVPVVLPELGETIHLRKPSRFHTAKAMELPASELATLSDGTLQMGQMATLLVGQLRYALCDEEGVGLLRSTDEAIGFFNLLGDEDTVIVMEALSDILGDGSSDEDGDAGKGH